MKTLMHIFVLSCKKATLLIEKKQAGPLNPLLRLQLFVHLKICDGCLNYEKQSRVIETLLKNDYNTLEKLPGLQLSEKSKALIQKSIEEKIKKN